MEASDIVEKLSLLIAKWLKIFWAWALKFLKIRIQKYRLRRAQRSLDRRMSRLGSEFYSLYRQGETEFLKSLVVHQQLKIAQEAESQVLAVYDRIDEIGKEYTGRIEELRGVI
jgi:hypothetical protein